MNFNFNREASNELDEAFEWYENQQLGLGNRFIAEVESSITRILYFPSIGRIIIKDIRRFIIPNFPYGIMYSVNNEVIEIYAIAHLHRKPYYWKERKAG